MKWTHKPPAGTGWWFVGEFRKGRFHHNIVDVKETKSGLWWSFIDGLTWNSVDEYPNYWWAGPIVCPNYRKLFPAKMRKP